MLPLSFLRPARSPVELPRWLSGEEPACHCRRHRRHGFDSWVGKIPWKRKWPPTPGFLPGESHGQRSLVGYSPCGQILLNMTGQLTLKIITAGPYLKLHPPPRLLLSLPFQVANPPCPCHAGIIFLYGFKIVFL